MTTRELEDAITRRINRLDRFDPEVDGCRLSDAGNEENAIANKEKK